MNASNVYSDFEGMDKGTAQELVEFFNEVKEFLDNNRPSARTAGLFKEHIVRTMEKHKQKLTSVQFDADDSIAFIFEKHGKMYALVMTPEGLGLMQRSSVTLH